MSKVPRGPWNIRFFALDEETNVLLFLTSNGIGNVVTVEPGIQPFRQRWIVVPVEGKKDYYRIGQDLVSVSNPDLGLAQAEGSDKVILSEEPGEWHLEKLSTNNAKDGEVYRIRALPGFLPVERFLGKEGSQAVVELSSKPAWQFLIPE